MLKSNKKILTIVIRVDASHLIGIGHVMRCLALSIELNNTHNIFFICKPHDGNLINFIEEKGFKVFILSKPTNELDKTNSHSKWLGGTQENDAKECIYFLDSINVDWLIIDHYAIDDKWSIIVEGYYKKLLVIDDLSDRPNFLCDVLLNQSIGITKEICEKVVSKENCEFLLGVQYALLRPEFSELRNQSILNKVQNSDKSKTILLSFGGADQNNVTLRVLRLINSIDSSKNIKTIVVLGRLYSYQKEIVDYVNNTSSNIQIIENTDEMAKIMLNVDFAIGAAGISVLERCCLGLDSIIISLSDNQRMGKKRFQSIGIEMLDILDEDFDKIFINKLNKILSLPLKIPKCSDLIDGLGIQKVCSYLEENI